MSTQLDEIVDEELTTDKAKAAHIVKTEPGESATAKVMEARIFGYPIEALCGHTFVPQKDPQQLPMCQPCKEVYDMYRMANENLGDKPKV